MQIIFLWLILRIVTIIWVSWISNISRITQIEKLIQLWPPSTPITLWLERLLLAPWIRWDAGWYQQILTKGYQQGDGSTNFHPLYPILAYPFYKLFSSPIFSLLLISSICSFLIPILYKRLALLDLTPEQAQKSTVFFLFFPLSFILFAPYTEALFLLLSILFFLTLQRKHWWSAGLLGGLAALTRQQGVFLIIPFIWELWQNQQNRSLKPLALFWQCLSLGCIPLGLFAWLFYRSVVIGDTQLDFHNLYTFLYSLIISPSANKVALMNTFTWPWNALWIAISKAITDIDVDIVVNLILGSYFTLLLLVAWPKMRISYRLYSLVITLLSFSLSTGPIHPYMGLPRHLYLAFPVFIYASEHFMRPTWQRLVTVSSMIGMFFLLLLYSLQAWVP